MPPEEDVQAPPPPSSSRASVKRKNTARTLKPEAANDESPSPDISVPTPPPLNELPILPGSSGLRPPTPPSIPVSSIRHNAPSTPSTRDSKRQRLHSPPPTRSSSAASGARAPTVPSHRPSFYPPLYDGPGSSFYPPGHPQSQQFGFGGGGMGGPGPYRGGIPPGYTMPLRGAATEAFPQFSSGFFEPDARHGSSGAFDWPVHERQPQPASGAGGWFEMLGAAAPPPRSGNGHGTSWERGGPDNGTNGMADLLGVDQVDRG
ncbi:hypothetical protein CYLTODRAFT_37606 [Cylindrobasidium torrendii FP15055 ss-10]|uniref:Uncharacterized protein n=1 Tax=Cylindrobasidium torrendii FP15055 ss-10 TaxID=1314674 RepID=A0A0D7BS99_9AGAR|nr:hypothetical protein CYLTODRAFT_37606 [Cylindrobasidium torrendii FP15055 ss-10]